MWKVTWGNILTCDNLMKREITLVDWCCMCRSKVIGEILEHLLLHCDIAYEFWIYDFFFFNVGRIRDLSTFSCGGFRVEKKKNWREVRAV